MMDCVLGYLKWTMMLVYLDHIVIYATKFQEHFLIFTFVLGALHQANLQIKLGRCFFGFKEVLYLGHVNKNGIKPNPAMLTAVAVYLKLSCLSDI